MSNQIETWRVQQYKEGVYHLAQQKGSRLQMAVRAETQKGKSAFFDQMGSVSAVKRTGRHTVTPRIDTPHYRRRVTMADYEWADAIDDQDKLRILNDPTSHYTQAAIWAFGRSKDDIIIDALGGSAWSGEEGSTEVVLPTTQKIAAVKSSALSNINTETLRLAKYTFDKADIDPDLEKYFAISSSQLRALLAETEITSADYANVKALVEGKVDTFMGFKFINLERLGVNADSSVKFDVATGLFSSGGTASTGRKCYAWVKDGMLLSTGEDIVARVDERADMSYMMQAYVRMTLGATRMEEVKVVEVHCKE
jgi:hypothetical protein